MPETVSKELVELGERIENALSNLGNAFVENKKRKGLSGKRSDVNFYDYDGTVLYSYTAEDFLKLKKMPADPYLEGYEFRGWNWHFDRAYNYVKKYGKLEIGAMYAPLNVGRQSKIMINIPEDGRTNVSFCWRQATDKSVKVYFSDEQSGYHDYTPTDGKVVTSHNFPGPGEYTITFDPDDGSGFNFGDGVKMNVLNCNFTDRQEAMFGDYITEIVIGNTITEIGDHAFENCHKLEKIIIPDSVTSIEQYAFSGCYFLKSLTIPDSVTAIGQYAFSNCFALQSLTIPDSVTAIGEYAFYSCFALQSLTIPDSIVSIGRYTFYSSHTLQSLIIPDSITSIESYAFSSGYVLQSLTIPDSVTAIGQQAFLNYCTIKSLTIPDSVTSIGILAFYCCYALQSLTLLPETPPMLANVNAFQNIPSDCIIYVPYSEDHSILNAYKTATNWSTYADMMVESEPVEA